MAVATKIYWWSPLRRASDLRHELVGAPRAWGHQYLRTRRLFKNFGDEFSPIGWEIATGRQARWASPQAADVFAVGSILEHALARAAGAVIWGTGARGELDRAARLPGSVRVVAVRGPLTAKSLQVTNVAMGDPGLLVGQAVSSGTPRVSGRRVFVPHYRTTQTREGRSTLAAARSSGFSIVLPGLTPREVAQEIAQSQLVVTTSLHGLVFANALDRPCQFIAPPADEPTFKYRDYCGSLGVDYAPVDQAVALGATRAVDALERSIADQAVIASKLPAVLEALVAAAKGAEL